MGRRAPNGLGTRGRKFWKAVVAEFELTDVEDELLLEVVRTLDRLDELEDQVKSDGTMVAGSAGQQVLHPAIGEQRQQRITLGRLLGQLQLPDEDGETLPTPRQVRARQAAESRWGMNRGA